MRCGACAIPLRSPPLNTAESPSHSSAWNLAFVAWIVASTATLGSLFFSEVMQFYPCGLCWYQRIFMYPLVVLFGVALLGGVDKSLYRYGMPLVLIGLFFALYHNLLHYGVIPESAAPCAQGVPCSTVYINWFGFLTIPMLSLIAFSILLILLILLKRSLSHV